FIELKSAWRDFPQGAIVYAPMNDILSGTAQFRQFVAPGPRSAIAAMDFTRNSILVTWLDNVRNRLERYTLEDDTWHATVVDFDPNGAIRVQNTDQLSDDFFVNYTSFLEPPTL